MQSIRSYHSTVQTAIWDSRRRLPFIRQVACSGRESYAEHRQVMSISMQQGSEPLDVHGWDYGRAVKRVEKGIPGTEWKQSDNWFDIGTMINISIIIVLWT